MSATGKIDQPRNWRMDRSRTLAARTSGSSIPSGSSGWLGFNPPANGSNSARPIALPSRQLIERRQNQTGAGEAKTEVASGDRRWTSSAAVRLKPRLKEM
jgi:hypothetical protein